MHVLLNYTVWESGSSVETAGSPFQEQVTLCKVENPNLQQELHFVADLPCNE